MKNLAFFVALSTVAALFAVTVHGESLLDGVLDSPTNAQKTVTEKPAKDEGQTAELNSEDIRKLREEVTALRQELGRRETEVASNEQKQSLTSIPKGHIDNPATLYLRGGGGGKRGYAYSIELAMPIWKSDFAILLRSFATGMMTPELVTPIYRFGRRGKANNRGGEALCIWRPLHGCILSPHAGIGVRYEYTDKPGFLGDGKGINYYENPDGGGGAIAGRIGLLLDLKRVFIVGEYIVGSDSSELIGDVSFYLTRRMKLHAFAESIDLDLCRGTAYGGGISFDF